MTAKKERVNLSLPIGMSAKAEKLGINMSFYAAKAIQAEIEFQEARRAFKRVHLKVNAILTRQKS